MAEHSAEFEGLGPWSLQTSRRFWEGFTPAALAGEPARPGLRTVFRAECGWRRAESEVTRAGDTAHVVLAGDGDLDAAAAQACRFLALTSTGVAGRRWATGTQWWPMRRRGCPGCDRAVSIPPYEAAARSVLAQRLRVAQAGPSAAEPPGPPRHAQ